MKLHYHPVSTYSRKVQVALLHRGDPLEWRVIDVAAGELRSPEYRALSPFGKMPVLETEDGPIFESTSIIEWLEERGPRVLLPEGSERVVRHLDRIGDHYLMDPHTELWFRPDSEAARKAVSETVPAAWELLRKRLAEGRRYLAGDAFTLADIGAAIASDSLVGLGLVPPPEVARWVERCFCVPAMKQARADAMPGVEKMLARRAARMATD
ncbi:glutathione S-transferase family protein [Myxococcota bacterium]|nr:glutathione S-transferase family protein [Myxococcota bacterium]